MNLKIYSPKLAQGNFTNFLYHLLASPFVASADSQGRFIFLPSSLIKIAAINKERPQVCCLAARLGGLLSFSL